MTSDKPQASKRRRHTLQALALAVALAVGAAALVTLQSVSYTHLTLPTTPYV